MGENNYTVKPCFLELKVKFCLRFVQVYRSPSIFLIHQEEKRVILKTGDRLISSRSKNK